MNLKTKANILLSEVEVLGSLKFREHVHEVNVKCV